VSLDPDQLAEMARNRGLKLVRSRVRTPGKRRYGKVGLKTAKGEPLLGIDDKGPKAKPEEIEKYLRSLDESAWKDSLSPKRRR
jgi:hypothetical protein